MFYVFMFLWWTFNMDKSGDKPLDLPSLIFLFLYFFIFFTRRRHERNQQLPKTHEVAGANNQTVRQRQQRQYEYQRRFYQTRSVSLLL